MAMHDFRKIFQRETEHMIARLQHKSFERSRNRSSETSPASVAGEAESTGGSGGSAELAHLGELRRLAEDMVESVLQRLSDRSAEWAEEGVGGSRAGEASAAVRRAAEAEGSSAKARLQTRLQELEAELQAKRAEEAKARAELVAKCKAESDLALQAQEERLTELQRRRAAARDNSEGQKEAAELQHEFAEHVARIHSNIALTKDAVRVLENRMKSLEQIEGQQSRPLTAMEALLAHVSPSDADAMDDIDNPLVEAIRRGEQVCKRMRRSLAGA